MGNRRERKPYTNHQRLNLTLIIKVIVTISLVNIFWEDFKSREVHLFWFFILLLSASFLYLEKTIWQVFFISSLINLTIIIIISFITFLYIKFKLKMNFNQAFGWGDLLFFIAASFTFATYSFLMVFVIGLLFSLLMHIIVKRFQTTQSVPLAGYMSLFFALCYIGMWKGIIQSLYLY